LPNGRFGVVSTWSELNVACSACSCQFPKVPVLLLKQQQGEELIEFCRSGRRVTVHFTVKEDPKIRSLPRKLCQECAAIFSGIGVLYTVIQCFKVRVGAEFLAAELASEDLGIRCVCIDVGMDRLCSRVGWTILPTPCNLLNSFLSWIAFPRICFQFLFPAFGMIDSAGTSLLHLVSFGLKTWIAFFVAGCCASLITNAVLRLFTSGVEAGAEGAGLVEKKDREEATTYIILIIEMYLLPQVYDALVASRDEAMYRKMVRKCKEFAADSLVVVVGAGHANGILQHVRQRGL